MGGTYFFHIELSFDLKLIYIRLIHLKSICSELNLSSCCLNFNNLIEISYQVKDEKTDIDYNSFQYSFIGTLLHNNPKISIDALKSVPSAEMKQSVIAIMKDVFCKSMMSWEYLAFIIFYSGLDCSI